MVKYYFRGDNVERFIYVKSKEQAEVLQSEGFKMLFERFIDGEKVYVFLNQPDKVKKLNFAKGQLFSTDKLFF